MNNLKTFFNIENRTKYFIHFIVLSCITSILVFILLLIGSESLLSEKKVSAKEKIDPFLNITLEAKGAMVWDIVNGRELFSKNGDMPLPLASLTKVMTAIVADSPSFESSNIKITEQDIAPEGDSGLAVGDVWRASDLRDFTLLTSSNDGAFALSTTFKNRDLFIKAMNDKASEIGLSESHFFNEHGLDRALDKGGAYGSARDMATLFEYALKTNPKILEATRYKNLQFATVMKAYDAKNTNVVVSQIPGLIASKTGFTDLAGGNLVIAYDTGINHPIIVSILGSTEQGRFEDTLKLIDASIKYIQEN